MKYLKQLTVICLFLLTACSHDQGSKNSQLALLKTTNPKPLVTDQEKSDHRVQDIKKNIQSHSQIYDVAVIKGKKATLVVYKVKHLHRFRMKQIEKNLKELLESKYPKEKFVVSSDYKIFLEAVRLNERMKEKKISEQEAEKTFNKIIDMTEAMT